MSTPTPDVLIVGAGLAGASAAWHLAPGARVQVVDQGDQPAAEASAQNAGMQRRLAHDPVERALACRAGQWLADPPDGFAHALRPAGGVLVLEDDPHALDDAVEDLRSRGVRVEPAGDVPALRDASFATAWSVPDEHLIDGTALARAFLDGARRSGASLSVGTRVRSLWVEQGRVIGVHTDQGRLPAGRVVLASGAWTGRIAREHGLDRPLVPLARHLLHAAAHPVSRPEHPWVWVDDAGLYVRPEGGGWLCSPCDETAVEPATGPGSAGPVDPLLRALATAKLGVHLPAVQDARFARGWTGLRTFAPDRRPVIGPDPELDGLAWATGLGGFGVTCAAAVGELLCATLAGRDVPWIDVGAVAPGRRFDRPLRPATMDLERYG